MDFRSIIELSWDSYMTFLINNYYPYWQKYVKGVNTSLIECDPHLDSCALEIRENKIYTAIPLGNVCIVF
jgi:hypothetical protein